MPDEPQKRPPAARFTPSRRSFLIAGLAVVGAGTAAGVYLADDSGSDHIAAPTPAVEKSPAPVDSSERPQPRIRWSLRESTQGWQPGPNSPGTTVSHDPDGWLLAGATGRIQVASFDDDDAETSDWTLTDRPNDDRLSLTAMVQSPFPTATIVVSMVWQRAGSSDLTPIDSTPFSVPTGLEIDLDTWWDCRGNAPADVLTRVVGVRVTAIAEGDLELRIRDVRQPPSTATYGPAPSGLALMFTSPRPTGLPQAVASDPYAASVLARLDVIAAWARDNNRAVHIGEWAWPKEVAGDVPGSSASLTAWAGLAEQWMRKADELAIPYTPWGESAYWAGVKAGSDVNYGSYPDASYFCGDANYDRPGGLPRVVNAMKPSAAPLVRHMNAVSGIAPSINIVGGCFVYLKDGSQYSSTNIGQRGSDYFVENPATIDYLHSVGWRVFRMPFRWDRVMRTPESETLDPVEWGYVKSGIEHILSLPDTAVIVDQHSSAEYWISPVPDDRSVPADKHVVDGPDGRLSTADYVRLWKLISKDLRPHSKRLIYEITNEPNGPGASAFTVKRYTQAVVTALRAQGDRTFCLIPSFPFDNIASAIAERNQPFPWIDDPAGSHAHAYTFHHYMDSEMSGQYAKSYQAEVVAHQ